MIKNYWTIEIKSERGRFLPDWKELWDYRDLIYRFIHKDMIVVYKQTILGPLWYVLQPLLMSLMMIFVFADMAKMSTDEVSPILFYLSGLCIWSYFANVTNSVAEVFIKNSHIFGKVYFPRLVVPIALTISNLLKLMILLALLGVMIIAVSMADSKLCMDVNFWLLFFPAIVLLTAIFAMSIGMLVAALTVKYRDIYLLLGFGLQMFMFSTPIAYPLAAVPEKWRIFLFLNPLTSLIELFKYSLFGKGMVSIEWLTASIILIICFLFLSLWSFTSAEKTFIDKI